MFTGIVTDIGTLRRVEPRNDVRRLTIASRYDTATIELGASIACSGVCLTVVALQPDAFEVEAAPETLAVTTARDWTEGRRLNLERALKIGDELGGHVVQGHVDGVATVIAREDIGETTRFVFDAPEALAPFIAVKGSVTLDGTSLTVNEVDGTRFSCLLIPHTLAHTTWGDVHAGDHVNIEVDMMARYAARLAEFR
ncbi:riboflavin synthase, alpha subunit [Ancylobacter novellus DSM 506]|uniref:Riboflavin synthase n=1 Tax=Ancylobacter novellus (strain ATCC 8093 / DSM 506 / JCM 20403 / CCM 1077 / IAM 12100 / NBRC 12443 / NCIMB 10456) TaxID=639283 RepID=D7AAF7_ANCN5|nr:riboflavin synthase [Ancylobacter novellus]ADH88960.1 riboflavin synthase, alpha subunit [Ancylobacter novellus DSM 506]